MAGFKDHSDVSSINIIETTMETLPVEDQLEFEQHTEQLIKEAKAKYMVNFKVDGNQKVVRVLETNLVSLRPAAATPNVSNMYDIQVLRSYVDEQRKQMQQILGLCKMIIGC